MSRAVMPQIARAYARQQRAIRLRRCLDLAVRLVLTCAIGFGLAALITAALAEIAAIYAAPAAIWKG